DDAGVATVGGNSGPMSAKNLHVSTVGDELKLATGGRGKVVGVSFKDRAAILMAGHAADAVIWFDGTTSNWVTSTYYAKTLPRWVQEVNAEKVPASTIGKSWTPLLSDSAYRETRRAPFVKGAAGSPIFSHKISNGGDFTASSYGQEYVFRTAERAVSEERLGQDDVPDVLCINLATNDYVGHAYGPDSPEVMDMAVRTDRLFSEFFEYLHNHVNGGLASTVIVVTADHGIAPIPEESNGTYRLGHVVRGRASALAAAVNKALAAKYGDGKYVQYCYPPHIYIDHSLLETRHADLAEAERVAAAAARSVSGIYEAFAGEDILTGQVPDWPWMHEVANGYNRALSGDVMAFEVPGSIFAGGAGTTHGTPWAYDTHVPLMLFGPGVHAGTYSQRVSQCDIAPTLCRLLRIEQPSGSVGRLLVGALGG
ncbi:MAG TPA: alkaline phosphatase family protein, partial [Fimbriimonadaceae bacterium]|nr:alkaline phosphatase family protein [Fimbriimonadaceae bacterium]